MGDVMSGKFVASNGVGVRVDSAGGLEFGAIGYATLAATAALREFFQHERDEELGRWRSKIDPNWTAVLDAGYVKFRHDNGTHSFSLLTHEPRFFAWDETLQGIGKEYFAAHPEPKPWHDAKPGEVWELTTRKVDDRWNPAVFRVSEEPGYLAFCPVEPEYSVSHLGAKATAITAGRRIWPEVSDVQ